MKANFHTHTRFSDGKGEPEAFAARAFDLGFTHLGFSDHAPVDFENRWSLKWEYDRSYVAAIAALQMEYSGRMQIWRSLEMDYIPGITYPFSQLREQFSLDYTLGSVHLVRSPFDNNLWFIDGPEEGEYIRGLKEMFNDDIVLAVSCFYRQQVEMIDKERPDILGHFDKISMHNRGRFFREDDPWVVALQVELLQAARHHKTIVEINTRGIYKKRHTSLYPSEKLIRRCIEMEIPLMLSSDAHHPDELDGFFTETLRMLKDLGCKELMIFDQGQFRPVPLSLMC